MTEYSRPIVAGVVIAVLMTAFVAIELNGLYLPHHSSSASNTSTISSEQASEPRSFSSGISSDGLQLRVALNSTSIASNGAISVEIQLVNTLNQNVSVVVPPGNQTIDLLNQTLSNLNYYDFVCALNPSHFLVDFNLFEGHYTAGNISEAGTPLQVGVPMEPAACAVEYYPVAFTFLPNGVVAVEGAGIVNANIDATTTYCGPNPPPENGGNCGLGQGLVGYWLNGVSTQGDLNFTSPAFTYFPPGEYTLLAYDAWGQWVYTTFVVD